MNITLLHRIRRFCESHSMPESKFGRLAVSDPRLVGDMRKGRSLRPGTIARIRHFMEAQS